MNEKTIKWIRFSIKVLLCISLIISVGLLLNYIRNLNPTADGFDVSNFIARLIHGDGYWTWEKLTSGLYVLFGIFAVLFCFDKAFDMICMKQRREKNNG